MGLGRSSGLSFLARTQRMIQRFIERPAKLALT